MGGSKRRGGGVADKGGATSYRTVSDLARERGCSRQYVLQLVAKGELVPDYVVAGPQRAVAMYLWNAERGGRDG